MSGRGPDGRRRAGPRGAAAAAGALVGAALLLFGARIAWRALRLDHPPPRVAVASPLAGPEGAERRASLQHFITARLEARHFRVLHVFEETPRADATGAERDADFVFRHVARHGQVQVTLATYVYPSRAAKEAALPRIASLVDERRRTRPYVASWDLDRDPLHALFVAEALDARLGEEISLARKDIEASWQAAK